MLLKLSRKSKGIFIGFFSIFEYNLSCFLCEQGFRTLPENLIIIMSHSFMVYIFGYMKICVEQFGAKAALSGGDTKHAAARTLNLLPR